MHHWIDKDDSCDLNFCMEEHALRRKVATGAFAGHKNFVHVGLDI